METPVAKNILAFQGVAFDLVLASIGDYALVLVLRSGRPALRLALAFEEIMTAQKDLLAFLGSPAIFKTPEPAKLAQASPAQGVTPAEQREAPPKLVVEPDNVEEPAAKEMTAADFDAIFQQASPLKAEDVDAFWDSASEAPGAGSSNPGGISYDQARQMGLASGLEEDKH